VAYRVISVTGHLLFLTNDSTAIMVRTVMSTVLVVDDDPDIRTLMSITLRAAGHRVIEAAEGRSALEVIASEEVDVILLDLMMPVMDGWAVLWRLHDRPVHPPVIVMSALPEKKHEHPPLGAVRYLHKPFPLDDAISSIQEALAC
jgi:two-component system KDP operon response regulator KdpE